MKAVLVHEDHIAWMSTQTNVYALDAAFHGFGYIAVSMHEPAGPDDAVPHGAEIIGCNEHGSIEADLVEALYRTNDGSSFAEVLALIGYTETKV